MEKKERELQRELSSSNKPTEIPKTTLQPLYKKILAKDALRRQKAKEASLARNRTQSKPFSFHERDVQKARERLNACEDIDDRMLQQFRARNVPWRILIPRFKMMVERDEHEREQRIIRNAEESYKRASLPPRMQAHEDEKKRRAAEEMDSEFSKASAKPLFSFSLPRPRSVPDFRRIQRNFVNKMEALKKSKKPTAPRPFKFNPPRPQAKLFTHMDLINQVINPTLAPRRARSAHFGARDQLAEQPSTTVKHQAIIEKNRAIMEGRKLEKESKFQSDLQRFVRQNRLQQRVNLSPALVSNSASLKQKREEAQARARHQMARLQKQFEGIKANISFNVANRPLLLEQVSKAFMHNLKQIKELQRYVDILQKAGMAPEEHLSAEQRELLVSAEYFDRLNLATAYFPPGAGAGEEAEGQAEERGGAEAGEALEGAVVEEEDEEYEEGEEDEEEAQVRVDERQEVAIEQDEADEDDDEDEEGEPMAASDDEEDRPDDDGQMEIEENEVMQEDGDEDQHSDGSEGPVYGEEDEEEPVYEISESVLRQLIY